jgi:IMP dehydrogenase
VKVGIGAGSICTTRIVSGIGVPQITAVLESTEMADKYGIPVISDGGVKYSGDIVKALAAGAHVVMMGSMLAGCEESPGETEIFQAASSRSIGAWAALGRWRKAPGTAISSPAPKSSFRRASRAACLTGARIRHDLPDRGRPAVRHGLLRREDIEALRTSTEFVRITNAGLRESHPHDIYITKEAPNYTMNPQD